MSTTVASRDKPPTKEQLAKIEELSAVVLGDRDRLFEVVGHPLDTWEASAMLGALHKVRNKMEPLKGREADFHTAIHDLKTQPTLPPVKPSSHHTQPPAEKEEAPKPMVETKQCPRCDTEKPHSEFHKNKSARSGLNSWCKTCVSDHRQEKLKDQSKGGSPASDGESRGTGPATPPPAPASITRRSEPDPPLSDGWQSLADPRLSDLRKLQELLEQHITDSVGLEETAEVATAIAATFGRKEEDDS